jgi:hypothetical protein
VEFFCHDYWLFDGEWRGSVCSAIKPYLGGNPTLPWWQSHPTLVAIPTLFALFRIIRVFRGGNIIHLAGSV